MADLNAMVIFAKVIEAGSFSEAARRLKMPVSTVSRRVADLEDQLGLRLLERSTRNLRLTDIGSEILEHALRGAEVQEAVESIVSDQLADVTGTLRLSAPPSISDSLLSPIVSAFQTSYPAVRIQILITNRYIDHIAEGVDLTFRVGLLKDSALVARKILSYRRRLVASPAYLERHGTPERPGDLLNHRVLAFAQWRTESRWRFLHVDGEQEETVTFEPHLGINDFTGVSAGLLAGLGVGDLSPLVLPDLVAEGKLVEVMTEWRFPAFDLSLIHLGNRHMPRAARVFKEFAAEMAPILFPALPA